jgi:DNA-binding response OmpR family regulator
MEYVVNSGAAVLHEIGETGSDDALSAKSSITLLRARSMRVGAFTLDAQTSAIRWRGEPLSLSREQRQLLQVLLQHAGQILSCDRLSSTAHVASGRLDAHMQSLRATLETAGVTWLPRRAEGCGYILWR